MFLLLLVVFIIFNGAFTLEILFFGIGISLAVCAFCCLFMGYSPKKELKVYKKLPLVIAYLFMLIFEIIKANICTAGLIFKGRKKIEPTVVTFTSPFKSELAGTMLANSITLTPGTISVSFREGKFTVHCLDGHLGEGIDSSGFVKLLKKIEE